MGAVPYDHTKARFGGVMPGRYQDGDIQHILNPVIGWLRLDMENGDLPDNPTLRMAIERMEAACQSEKDFLAGNTVDR